jgi:Uncharacterized protein conserved in bacteria (DUF2252)
MNRQGIIASIWPGYPVEIKTWDAHLNNFEFCGTPQRDLVMDLNDFDEATFGPWEWDLKRLVASVNAAARENGMSRRDRRSSVMRCVEGYRMNAKRLQAMPAVDVWYLHAHVDRTSPLVKIDPESQAILAKAAAKARLQNNAALLEKIAERRAHAWQFRTDPSILTPISSATQKKVIESLSGYRSTLLGERKGLLRKYHVVDVAHRVEFLVGEQMSCCAWACGARSARAHARTGEPALIAGYCGGSKALDDWAEAYGDQTEADHAALVKAIESGQVKAVTGV